jgi:hypothetical protein
MVYVEQYPAMIHSNVRTNLDRHISIPIYKNEMF